MPENEPDDAVIQIRRYPNRRFYDSTQSRHVKLEEIHEMVRAGHTVEVTDSKTGKDITSRVLAQIMIDQDSAKMEVFPAPLMHLIIRSNESFVGDFVEQYFNQALQIFLQSRQQFEEQFKRATDLSAGGPPGMDWTRNLWGAFGSPSPRGATAAPPPHAPPSDPGESRSAEELKQDLDRLMVEIEKLKKNSQGK